MSQPIAAVAARVAAVTAAVKAADLGTTRLSSTEARAKLGLVDDPLLEAQLYGELYPFFKQSANQDSNVNAAIDRALHATAAAAGRPVSVIDVGAGPGNVLEQSALADAKVVCRYAAIEPSATMLASLYKTAAAKGFPTQDAAEADKPAPDADGRRFVVRLGAFAAGSKPADYFAAGDAELQRFDAALMLHCLYHFEDPGAAVKTVLDSFVEPATGVVDIVLAANVVEWALTSLHAAMGDAAFEACVGTPALHVTKFTYRVGEPSENAVLCVLSDVPLPLGAPQSQIDKAFALVEAMYYVVRDAEDASVVHVLSPEVVLRVANKA